MQNERDILKWLNGDLQGEELERFKGTEEFMVLQPVIDKTSSFKRPDFDLEKALNDFKTARKSSAKVKKQKPWRAISVVAASLLALICMYFVWNGRDTTINTAYAQTATVTLPDASEVRVNAGSALSYNKKEWDRTRRVTLKGEAFFKVSKGKRFTVHTDQGIISVLGTQFNILDRKDRFEVSCYAGKVAVEVQGKKFVLKPGRSITVDKGKIGNIEDFEGPVPDWVQNKSIFNNVPFSEVIGELERQYAIKVDVDKDLLHKNFTGAIVHDDLESALTSICFPMNLEYKVLDNHTVWLYAKK